MSAFRASSMRHGSLLVSVSNSAALYNPRQFRRVFGRLAHESPESPPQKPYQHTGQQKLVTRDTICDLPRPAQYLLTADLLYGLVRKIGRPIL